MRFGLSFHFTKRMSIAIVVARIENKLVEFVDTVELTSYSERLMGLKSRIIPRSKVFAKKSP